MVGLEVVAALSFPFHRAYFISMVRSMIAPRL